MKEQILQIAHSLEKGRITEEEAKSEFLSLFGVIDLLKAEHKRGLDNAAQAQSEYEYRAGYYD